MTALNKQGVKPSRKALNAIGVMSTAVVTATQAVACTWMVVLDVKDGFSKGGGQIPVCLPPGGNTLPLTPNPISKPRPDLCFLTGQWSGFLWCFSWQSWWWGPGLPCGGGRIHLCDEMASFYPLMTSWGGQLEQHCVPWETAQYGASQDS